MKQNPLVSILMPAYNSEKWIAESIHSALAQTWSVIELIIVDDGSTDNTLAIAKEFEGEKVKIFSQENNGASSARNRAFSESSGDYIQYLDADDLLAPDKILLQMNMLLNSPDRSIASCTWGTFLHSISEINFKPTVLWKDFSDPVDWLTTAWSYNKWMPNMAWLTSRPVIHNAGPWNEELSLHDDGEFFSRVLLASKGVIFCNKAKVYYRKGLQQSLSQQRSLKAEISRLKVYELYESHIRGVQNSSKVKSACADNYQKFIYRVYPRFPFLLDKAEAHVNRLGGSKMVLRKNFIFNSLSSFLGWKRAIMVESLLLRNGLMPHQLKRKFLN